MCGSRNSSLFNSVFDPKLSTLTSAGFKRVSIDTSTIGSIEWPTTAWQAYLDLAFGASLKQGATPYIISRIYWFCYILYLGSTTCVAFRKRLLITCFESTSTYFNILLCITSRWDYATATIISVSMVLSTDIFRVGVSKITGSSKIALVLLTMCCRYKHGMWVSFNLVWMPYKFLSNRQTLSGEWPMRSGIVFGLWRYHSVVKLHQF
jgi:hypothetical protein